MFSKVRDGPQHVFSFDIAYRHDFDTIFCRFVGYIHSEGTASTKSKQLLINCDIFSWCVATLAMNRSHTYLRGASLSFSFLCSLVVWSSNLRHHNKKEKLLSDIVAHYSEGPYLILNISLVVTSLSSLAPENINVPISADNS